MITQEEERATEEETSSYFAVLNEIQVWHDTGLVKYQHPHCRPMSLEHWNLEGRPKSFSPIMDHFMTGLYPNRREGFAAFCKQYLAELQTARFKRCKPNGGN